jgi:WD40 repeat protein
VWSLEAGDFGREITTLSNTSSVYALAIHDSKLYSGSEDNTIKVWSV